MINTNTHCSSCNKEIDLNNRNNNGEIVCTNCWLIYND